MSSLWRVRVLAVTGSTVTLELRMIHPDAGPFPSSRAFAVRLLADVLPDGVDSERADDIVDSVELSDERNVPFDVAAAEHGVEREVRARGLAPTDGDAWLDAFAAAWREFWEDSARVPTASLTVRLADPSWLRGLTPGTGWETAAYG